MISIVEDNRFVRDSIGRLMRSFGYAAEVFPSAPEFLAFPRLGDTACLIADINMPGMTGLELHRRLIEAGLKIPTILITAYPDDDVRTKALADGVLCYLRKPFDDEELLGCVRKAFDTPKAPAKNS